MKIKLIKDISNGKNGLYAKQGDEVELITSDHHPVLIVSKGTDRFSVHIDNTSLSVIPQK